jgi:hypothetical protein
MRVHTLNDPRADRLSGGTGIAKQSEAHLPPDERRQVIRIRAEHHASVPGIKGGQGRSGREIEESSDRLAWVVGATVVFVVVLVGARVLG